MEVLISRRCFKRMHVGKGEPSTTLGQGVT